MCININIKKKGGARSLTCCTILIALNKISLTTAMPKCGCGG